MRSWIYIALLNLLVVTSCDTSSSIDPPNDSFFVKFFGNDGNQEGVDFVQNTDGTLTLFGNIGTAPNRQLYLVNVEPNGNLLWERTYGDAKDDNAKDIELTNDGRLVIVSDYGSSPNRDIKIMTLTLDGNKTDSTLTGFPVNGNSDETASSITQTDDGFLVAGSTSNVSIKPDPTDPTDERDALQLRFFDNLNEYPPSWRKTTGPGDIDESTKIIQIAPDQFYFFGYSNASLSGGAADFNLFILSLGSTGEADVVYSFLPGNPGTDEKINSVVISPAQSGEGFLLSGITSNAGSADIFLAKLRKSLAFDASDFLFQKNLGAALGAIRSEKTAVYPSLSSGFLMVSNMIDVNGVQNFYLDRIDAAGNRVWQSPFIYGGEQDDTVGAVQELPDGSIVMIGTFAIGEDGERKMTLIKVNGEGKFLK